LTSLIKKIFAKRFSSILPPPYPMLVLLDRYFSERQFPDVVFFGDSVALRTAKQDTDARDLGRMLNDNLHSNRLSSLVLSHSAYHMLVFKGFVLAMQSKERFPQIIIIPVNLRSFSPQWDLQPYWQFDNEIRILQKYGKTHGTYIGRLRTKRREEIHQLELQEFRNTVVNYPLSELNTIGQFVDVIESVPREEEDAFKRKREIFVFHYAYPLASTHRKLNALIEILDLLSEHEVKVLIYVTPVNYKAGERFVGDGFKHTLDANRQVVRELVCARARPGLAFADWSCLFTSDYFFSEDLATEHINDLGRKELSRYITQEVLTLLEMKDR
jgi:hypothetical protein